MDAEAELYRRYLDTLDDQAFDYAVRQFIEFPDPVEDLVLFSPAMARRVSASLTRTRRALSREQRVLLSQRSVDEDRLRRARRLANECGVRAKQLQVFLGQMAVLARRDNEALMWNARARAKERLAQRHVVEFLRLVREERKSIARERATRRAQWGADAHGDVRTPADDASA